jgi:hypothetical protein
MWNKLDMEAKLLLIATPIMIIFFGIFWCTGWRP